MAHINGDGRGSRDIVPAFVRLEEMKVVAEHLGAISGLTQTRYLLIASQDIQIANNNFSFIRIQVGNYCFVGGLVCRVKT
jgi:hypothetical protein